MIYALNKGEITQNDVEMSYQILKKLEDKYVNDLEYLKQLTKDFWEKFH